MTKLCAGRRKTVFGLAAAATGAAMLATHPAAAAETAASPTPDALTLRTLMAQLSQVPRRRDFKTVPMVLDHPDLWDSEALEAVIAYRGARKQVWDNTDIGSPWMNLMRNALNAQVFSFRHPDFLVVSATHGSAHLALYDQAAWDKYQLRKLAGAKFATNTLIVAKDAPGGDAAHEDPESLFGAAGNTIPTLRKRGVVFMACHNAIWEQTGVLMAKGINPDGLTQEAMAADLTNHLVDGVVLTPGIVATIPELEHAGFGYVK